MAGPKKLPHCSREGDYSATSPRVRYADGGRLLQIFFERSPGMEWNQEQFPYRRDGKKRGQCKGYSRGSRRRMMNRLNEVSVEADLPAFIGLTYPDESYDDDPEKLSKKSKVWFQRLLKRMYRACPSACGFWKQEWKKRKTGLHEGKPMPHLHTLDWGFPQRVVAVGADGKLVYESFVPVRDCQASFSAMCRDVIKNHVFADYHQGVNMVDRLAAHEARRQFPDTDDRSWMSLFDWLSLNWYQIVGSGNVAHFQSGVEKCEQARTWRGALSYVSKMTRYISKDDTEDGMADVPAGRSWGIFNRACMPWAKIVEMPVSDEVGNRLRRVACHCLSRCLGRRVQRHYGLTHYCDVSQWKRLLEPSPPNPF